jgi:fructose-1,6-bisphosphatase II / sedoheptulose-1,7-bisphosphatase
MQKIASNINKKDVIDLDYSIKKNIFNLAEFKNKKPENLTVCILDRPRHDDIINDLKSLKVNLKLITDGDVSGALLVTDNKFGVDLFIGTGGSPEGVLAAAALDAYNCSFQGRFLFKSEDEKKRAKKMGITDLEKKYELNEIVKGDTIFCATGITKGDMVAGISIENDEFTSETLITHKSTGLKKIIKIRQKI